MSAKRTRPVTKPTPIRFPEAMLEEVAEMAECFNLSRQDVFRISVAAGLEAMRQMGVDGLARNIAGHFPGMRSGTGRDVSSLDRVSGRD